MDPHFLESLDLDPDPHFDLETKIFFCFFGVNEHKFFHKNEDLDLDLDPQIFGTLNPDPHQQIFETLDLDLDPHEMDADLNRGLITTSTLSSFTISLSMAAIG